MVSTLILSIQKTRDFCHLTARVPNWKTVQYLRTFFDIFTLPTAQIVMFYKCDKLFKVRILVHVCFSKYRLYDIRGLLKKPTEHYIFHPSRDTILLYWYAFSSSTSQSGPWKLDEFVFMLSIPEVKQVWRVGRLKKDSHQIFGKKIDN